MQSKSIRSRRILLMLYIIYKSRWACLAQATRIPSGATLVLTGIKSTQAGSGRSIRRPRLPTILPSFKGSDLAGTVIRHGQMMSGLGPLSRFVCSGFPLRRDDQVVGKTFDARVHLRWGDVAIDDRTDQRAVKVHLCRPKTDQLRNGVDVVIGRAQDCLGGVAAVGAFMA